LAALIPAFIPSRKSVEPIGAIGAKGHIGTVTLSPLMDLYPASNPAQKASWLAKTLEAIPSHAKKNKRLFNNLFIELPLLPAIAPKKALVVYE
jgi:hypothetical protein